MMKKKGLLLKSVVYGEGKAESESKSVEQQEWRLQQLSRQERTHGVKKNMKSIMIEDTVQSLWRIFEANKRILLAGDFSCKEVDWETFWKCVVVAIWHGGKIFKIDGKYVAKGEGKR